MTSQNSTYSKKIRPILIFFLRETTSNWCPESYAKFHVDTERDEEVIPEKPRGGIGSDPPGGSGLTRHHLRYWRNLECLGGGSRPPLLSREPLVVESRARRHSKALHKTRQNHLSEQDWGYVRSSSVQRSKSCVLTFWALGTRIIEPDGSNSGKMLSETWLRYGMSTSGILRKFKGQGQVTKGHYMWESWLSRVTRVLWSNFDVELESQG